MKFPWTVQRKINTPAEEKLEAGDCILEVNGQEIGPNLYKLDKIINELGATGKTVELTIVRYGQKIKVSIF